MGNNELKDESTPAEEETTKGPNAESEEREAVEELQRRDEPESFQKLYQESLKT